MAPTPPPPPPATPNTDYPKWPALSPAPAPASPALNADTLPLAASSGTFYRKFSLHRTFSRYSRRSYISNLSSLNRANLARFGRSKIAFLFVNTIFTFAAIALLVFVIFTLFEQYSLAPIIKLWRLDVLYVLAASALLQLILGIIGFIGAFGHKKVLLTLIMLLIWPLMVGYLYAGYISYLERNSSQWEANLSANWASYGQLRHNIQLQFQCCGFNSDFDRPFPDAICIGFFNSTSTALSQPRLASRAPAAAIATLPGCHDDWADFSKAYLSGIYIGAFSIVPFIIIVFVVLILGANHIYMD